MSPDGSVSPSVRAPNATGVRENRKGQTMSTAKDSKRIRDKKRILSVTIRRMIDESPDTSHLGEYSDQPASEFSIDRAHELDCPVNLSKSSTHDYKTESGRCANCDRDQWDGKFHECEDFHCDCIGDSWNRREFRYFDASFNYVTKDGKPSDGLTSEDIRKYVRQDYERMEILNRGDWCYVGIRAEAEVQLTGNLIQRIRSGGLWGIESDSDRSYFDEIQKDELANLKTELLALGFSKRAIAEAFKPENIKEKDA